MEQKKHNQKYRVGIVTLSDKGFKGEREDLSGPKIKIGRASCRERV